MDEKKLIKLNDEMLKALISGKKTQVSFPMLEQPTLNGKWWSVYGASWSSKISSVIAVPYHSLSNNCPYGQFGEVVSYADKEGNIKGKIKITKVWIQPVSEISQDEAVSEGFQYTGWRPTYNDPDSGGEAVTPYDNYADAWVKEHGESGWDLEEWAWFIKFEKVE